MSRVLRHPPEPDAGPAVAAAAPLPTPPLPMPDQDFAAAFRDPAAGRGLRSDTRTRLVRAVALLVPLAVSGSLGWLSLGWFAHDGHVSAVEAGLAAITAFAFYWVVLSVVTALLGLGWRAGQEGAAVTVAEPLRVAILLPMYGEPALATISQAVALLARLGQMPTRHAFSLHILSDTREAQAAGREQAVCAAFQRSHPRLAITYRRRAQNTDFKSGNIRAWVRGAGARFDAMLVLDADSVMAAASVRLLADRLAADPACGLMQTVPRVLPGTTVWQRMQSFASEVYGTNLARGFARWSGREANYLGHNALIRVRAFAASAGLPHLPGKAPRGGVILSHDFVEAALLCRAGWGVRMLPEATESYEQTPETLTGYLRRDRRWCQGNMQHLRLLAMPGLHPLSRFHLLQGAMAYLASLWWLVLLVLWSLPDGPAVAADIWAHNPLMPVWPVLPAATQTALLGLVGLMLVAPKLIGIAAYLRDTGVARGRRAGFAGLVLTEMLLSLLMAPTLMVHQVRAILGLWAGVDGGWSPHQTERAGLGALLRLHALETGAGVALLGLAVAGLVSPWLAPVAASLCLAVPLAWLVQRPLTGGPLFAVAQVAE